MAKRPPNDVSPFTTPGTRLRWSSGAEWVAVAHQLFARRCSSAAHRQQAAHLEELARRVDFLSVQPPEDLEAILAVVRARYPVPRGKRAGHPRTIVMVEASNAVARARAGDNG